MLVWITGHRTHFGRISIKRIEKGNFYPQAIDFGKLFTLNSFSDLIKNFDSKKYKTICINDDYGVQDYETKMSKLVSLFEKKFPEKSRFEK